MASQMIGLAVDIGICGNIQYKIATATYSRKYYYLFSVYTIFVKNNKSYSFYKSQIIIKFCYGFVKDLKRERQCNLHKKQLRILSENTKPIFY